MKEDFWLTEFEHFPELQTFGVCLLDSFSAFLVLPPLFMSILLSFHRTRICIGCYTQEVSQLCCAVDSFDFNDAANLGHVPPFVLLHHCYKVHILSLKSCTHLPIPHSFAQKMRDAGTLPPRGTKLTVLIHPRRFI